MTEEELLYFNGIDGATGTYGLPPMRGEDLSAIITGEAPPENLADLQKRIFDLEASKGVKEGVEPTDLGQAGWGVVFAGDADPAIQEALSELLALREEQAGEHFRVYAGEQGVQPQESKTKFLARHGVGPGPADPEKVPYYLLLVGSPEAIPFPFQYQLDVQYAVGRIHFETLEGYAQYARSVVSAEAGQAQLPRRCTLFGVANPKDRATKLSVQQLVKPLLEYLQEGTGDWEIAGFVEEEATKAQLQRLLGGDQTPALLFTASHGMQFAKDDPRQLPHQGALLCQDWPGPKEWQGKIPPDFYFAGDDLADDASLLGLIAFHFACFAAGTPRYDQFARRVFADERAEIAPYDLIAQLPTRLLSRGALAVIGHVDRAWGYSFYWPGAGSQTRVFESALRRLLKGDPVGHATDFFDLRYAELSSDLSAELDEIEYGKDYDRYELAGMWTANNDARGYVVLGDPAVRLPQAAPVAVTPPQPPEERPYAVTLPPTPEVSGDDVAIQKPAELSDVDWQQTPLAVKAYIQSLEARLRAAEE